MRILIIFSFLFLIACSGSHKISNGNPEPEMSVAFQLKDGTEKQGLVLSADAKTIKFMDNETNKPAEIAKSDIRAMRLTNKIFDMEGREISKEEIQNRKGLARTLGYGVGGTVLGAAVGFGVGIAAKNLFYPMLGGAVIGAYLFGSMGSDSDRRVAIREIRSERFEKSKAEIEKEMKKTREYIKQKEKEKKELEKKMKEIEKKKSETMD